MGEANRRAIAQGFDDAEHRRLQLNVEAMQREQMKVAQRVMDKRHAVLKELKDELFDPKPIVYGKASDLIEHQREINDAHYVDEPLDTGYKVADKNWPYIPDEANKPLVVYDAPTNGSVSIEPGTVYTVATEPLTTKKICAGEYVVTRNRDGKVVRIDKARSGWWQLNDDGVVSRHDTLAAAKAAIPA